MRVIVCGGRDFTNADLVAETMCLWPPGTVVVTGGARGADQLAHDHAVALGMATEVFPADWKSYGKGAGPYRNQAMLDAGAGLVVAFPGGKGTADMVRRARLAGVPVQEVQ